MKESQLFDEYPEWVGMPEFNQQNIKPFKEIIVRFETEKDYINFQKQINQQLTNKTKSIWHPFKSHWGLEKKVYVDEP
jgi:hypothetical protein